MACLTLVSGGVGIAPVPVSAMNIQLPRVSFVTLSNPQPTSSLYCVYRRDDEAPLLARFLKVIRDHRSAGSLRAPKVSASRVPTPTKKKRSASRSG